VRCLIPSLFVVFALSCSASAQLEFRKLDEPIIQARLESFSKKNDEREAQLKKLFVESGCDANHLSEQLVKKKLAPNLICVLPGQTDDVILVGGHFDKVNVGEGVVDNWSGASLLPSLLYSLNDKPRHHTFVFVSFTGEELGLVGSDFYAKHLPPEQLGKIAGMVNLDTLGLGPTKIWATHADPPMLFAIAAIAQAMKLPIGVVNVDQVGLTDSESFAKYKVPRITIHSITQETWPILHTDKDKLSAIKMDDYYATYRLLGGYLSYLDTYLGSKAAQPAPAKPPAQ
jgi:hypothetical protein